jgi:predicted lipid-binding transport protein (Tim44 family)
MAKQKSVARRIAADRAVSGFWASIAALPPLAAGLLMLFAGYRFAIEADAEDRANLPIILGMVGLFAFLFFIVMRWTYDAVHAGLTPQRVQAMWLRRFQSEAKGFRPSRVIDRLSRHGVSALTLQDRDVQLSWEQRRNRLAPIFWLLFIPIVLVVGYALWNSWQELQTNIANTPPAQDLRGAIGQIIGGFFAILIVGILLVAAFFVAVFVAMATVMVIAALAGPIGRLMSSKRDDYRRLPAILRRYNRGKRHGATVVRVGDENWRAAVSAALGVADVAIIDLSNVSENIAWEIDEAVKACTASGLVFICRDGVTLSEEAKAAVRKGLGREGIGVVHYPQRRGASDKAFARSLREQIYNAADLRGAAKA